jgi:hypothetical protein
MERTIAEQLRIYAVYKDIFGQLRKHKNRNMASLPGNKHKSLFIIDNYLRFRCKFAFMALRTSVTHFRGFPSHYARFRLLHATWMQHEMNAQPDKHHQSFR